MTDHYRRLGVTPTASTREIRDAYRRAARAAHPDGNADGSVEQMVMINEAWRVLGDAARRREYDATRTAVLDTRHRAPPSVSQPDEAPVRAAPARFPWRFLMMLAAVGIAVVVVGAALTDPGEAPPIDNLLMPGECVAISGGLEASEVICDGRHDGVVQVVVGFDQACPTGTQQVRDRQGRGWACIVSPPN